MIDAAFFLALALDELAQSIAIAILLKLVLSLTQRWPAHLRCRLIGVAIASSVLMPLCAFLPDWSHLDAHTAVLPLPIGSESVSLAATGGPRSDQINTCLLAIWAIGSAFAALRIGMEIRQLSQAARSAAISTQFTLPGATVALSDWIPRPVVFGYARQFILLPSTLGDSLSPETLRALLAHEYAHVGRRDTWVALTQRVLGALLWWNPIIHWMNGQLNDEREKACDAIAATACGGRAEFAQALVDYARSLVEGATATLAVGVAAKKSQLNRRVRYLLEAGSGTAIRPLSAAVCGLATLGLGGITMATPRITIIADMPVQRASGGEAKTVNAEVDSVWTTGTKFASARQFIREHKALRIRVGRRTPDHGDPSPNQAADYRQYDLVGKPFQILDRLNGQYRQDDAIGGKYAQYDRIGDRYRQYDALARPLPEVE